MTWTYSGDPSSTNLDAVRFLIGDTDTNDQQLQDAEVEWLLTENGSVYNAAAAGCETLAAKYARKVDKAVGDLRLAAQQKFEHYRDLAVTLRSRTAKLAMPFAGGISVASKLAYEANSDRVAPAFTRSLHENGGTSTDDD